MGVRAIKGAYEKTLRRAHELLELADLADKKERLIVNLSHGEKRTLCLIQLLLGKPEILILTSPFSGLIPKDAQKMRELIKYFGETYTIFLCTPSPKDLCEMCEEVIILHDGTLKSIAPVDESLPALLSSLTEASPAPTIEAAPQKRQSNRLHILMQKSDEYEVLDNDEKEDKN